MTDKQPNDTPPTPKKRRHVGKWILLLVLSLVALDCLVRLCYVSNHTQRAFAALPEKADLVGEFTDLSTSWGKTLNAPRVGQWLRLADVDAAELADDPGILWLIRLTTGKTVAAALELPSGKFDEKEIVLSAASYGGWRTPILRFLLTTRWIPGLGRLEKTPKGARYLRLGSKRHPSDFVVGFALRKDILVAVLSTDPDDVLVLDDRLKDREPAPDTLAGIAPWEHPEAEVPYRFWLTRYPGKNQPVDGEFSLRISPLWNPGATGKLAWENERAGFHDWLGASRISGRIGKAEALAADAAPVLFLLPPGLTRQELDIRLFHGERPASPPADRDKEEDAVVYLSQTPYGSTIKSIPLPAITILCPGLALNRPRIENWMASIAPVRGYPTLRGFKTENNRVYGQIDWLGRYGRHDPFRLSSSECGVIELPPNGRDLLFCSSMKSLTMQRSSRPSGPAPWKDWLAPRLEANQGKAVAFAWVDIDSLFVEGRKLLALAKLFQRLRPDSFRTEHLDLLYQIDCVLTTFQAPGKLALLATLPEENRLELEIGLE